MGTEAYTALPAISTSTRSTHMFKCYGATIHGLAEMLLYTPCFFYSESLHAMRRILPSGSLAIQQICNNTVANVLYAWLRCR